jgi:hypothetical protein
MEILALLLTGAFALTFVAFTDKPKKRKVKTQPIRVRANYSREYGRGRVR